jgi:hypothetical protein
MLKNKDMQDDYVVKGNDMREFRRVLANIDESTVVRKVDTKSIVLASYHKDISDVPNNQFRFRLYGREYAETGCIGNIKLSNAPDLIAETSEATKTMLIYTNKASFVSSFALDDIANAAGVGGSCVHEPCDQLHSLIVYHYNRTPKLVSLIIRVSEEGTEKLFAVRSNGYTYVPQSILCEIMDLFSGKIGKLQCTDFKISHESSRIHLTFPEVGKDIAGVYGLPDDIVPGLTLITSDVGENSITAVGTLSIRGAVITPEVFMRQHRGKIDSVDIKNSIEQRIFSRYSLLPERLCDLLCIEVSSPFDMIEDIARQIKLEKVIGKRLCGELVKAMQGEFGPGSATAYDIAVAFLTLSERLISDDLSEKKRNDIANVVCLAPFVKFEDPKIYLGIAS